MREVWIVFGAVGLAACSGGGCHTSVSKSWDASYSVSFGGATATTDAAATSATAIVDASTPEASEETIDSGLAPWMRSVVHLDQPDIVNLLVRDDGTFIWWTESDDNWGDCGQWRMEGTSLVLVPPTGVRHVSWPDVVDMTKAVFRKKGETIESRAFGANGVSVAQTWSPGQLCLGPSSHVPCTTPHRKVPHCR